MKEIEMKGRGVVSRGGVLLRRSGVPKRRGQYAPTKWDGCEIFI